MTEVNSSNQNVGHGHVFQRPDGVKARCGGPGICNECSLDLARQVRQRPVPDETLSHAKPELPSSKTLVEEFDEWNNVTGAIPNGIGWYYECRSILEDGDKEIERLQRDVKLLEIVGREQAQRIAELKRDALPPTSPQNDTGMLIDLLEQCRDFLYDDSGTPIAPMELRERVRVALTRHALTKERALPARHATR